MSQKSEDSIERFFRKGVVQQDKTFMERDWQRMEKMLDDQAIAAASARAAKQRTATRVGVVITLISLLVLIGVEINNSRKTVQMQAAVGAVGPRIEVKAQNPTADLHSSIKPEDAKAASGLSSPNEDEGKKVIGITQSVKQMRSSLTEVKTVSNNRNQGLPASSSESVDERVERQVGNAEMELVKQINHGPSLQESETLVMDEKVDEKESETEVKSLDIIQVAVEKETEKQDTEVGKSSRFSITAMVSPDFSTTTLSRYSKPSGVFGLLIGYRITKRFTVMAGATKSLKQYEGYGNEYSPPEGYWENRTNGVVPDEVQGQCGIIEVPLMVQYHVLQKPKSRFFISGGVSSYFMRSERYDYTFNEPNPGAASSWTAREPTDYLFKIGHLSAGYDHLVGKKFTIGIEPFLKVPFEGIGWTDINLYSTGAYINLRYNILPIHQD